MSEVGGMHGLLAKDLICVTYVILLSLTYGISSKLPMTSIVKR